MNWLRRNWKAIPAVILAALLSSLLVAFWVYRINDAVTYRGLTRDQAHIVRTLGSPARFTLVYLPLGEKGERELTRAEVWFYPEHGQSISFVHGRIVSVDDMEGDPVESTYPELRPWHFDVSMDLTDVESALGEEGAPVDPLPELRKGAEVASYATAHAVYSIERGRLVYLQTVGRGSVE